eukprot:jgi/Chrzof1/10920/Cz05g17080.t1
MDAPSPSKPSWTPVTTAFVQGKDGRVLVVRRSDKVHTYPGMWGGVSGGVEGGESLMDRAVTEIEEEVGIDRSQLQLLRAGRPLPVVDGHRQFLVHPFLFSLKSTSASAPPDISLNWESTQYQWVTERSENVVSAHVNNY